MTDTTFKREQRYIVFKLTDLQKHIEPSDLFNLQQIGRTVGAGREQDGKSPLECVVIESDWPEYDPTWRAIERRVSGAAQHAEGGEAAKAWDEGYRQGVEDERTSEANIGIAGFDAKVEPARQNPYRPTPPASQEQAQQPSGETFDQWLKRERPAGCVSDMERGWKACVASQQPSGGEVVAWRTFDGEGGYEYRDFEGNENYAVEWTKRNPRHKGWVEALTLATPKPEPMTEETSRLDWMATNEAHIGWNREGDMCRVWVVQDEEQGAEPLTGWHGNARAAIDEARSITKGEACAALHHQSSR